MTDKNLARKLLNIIEKWEETWDVWTNEQSLRNILKNEFDSDLLCKIYYFGIMNDFDEFKMMLIEKVNE